jgi:hypothetical protein
VWPCSSHRLQQQLMQSSSMYSRVDVARSCRACCSDLLQQQLAPSRCTPLEPQESTCNSRVLPALQCLTQLQPRQSTARALSACNVRICCLHVSCKHIYTCMFTAGQC